MVITFGPLRPSEAQAGNATTGRHVVLQLAICAAGAVLISASQGMTAPRPRIAHGKGWDDRRRGTWTIFASILERASPYRSI
ncbi:hypothetical protein CK216_23540 [Mesorhizobium sp. WSM3876]|nr:hypothetical protein CK216_23540 [Mesorhizobium sp. WSM3876]